MAEDKAAGGGSAGAGTLTKVREQAQKSPGASRLREELEHYDTSGYEPQRSAHIGQEGPLVGQAGALHGQLISKLPRF